MPDNDFEIDVVVPWVNGDDPVHSEKLASYLNPTRKSKPKSAHPTRYADMGELEFCISSILRFTPWVRRIFVVTDDQRPPFFSEGQRELLGGRIRLVDHRKIFSGYEGLLPTFNSLSIETMIWRIPGLAERFVYLNDDLAFIKPTPVQTFFQGDQIVLRGKEIPVVKQSLKRRIKQSLGLARSTHGAAQSNGATTADPLAKTYLATEHVPHPLRKSTLENFFRESPDVLRENAKHRFRHFSQFWPIGLANQLELNSKMAVVIKEPFDLYLDPGEMDEQTMIESLEAIRPNDGYHFLCVQSLDQASAAFYRVWKDWMVNQIGPIQKNAKGCEGDG